MNARDLLAYIPVVGSALDAYDSFKRGNIGLGLVNTGLAILDLTGVGAIYKGLTVGTMKYAAKKRIKEIRRETKNWPQMRRELQKEGIIPKNTMFTPRRDWLTTEHMFIKQKHKLPHRATNHPSNLHIGVTQSMNSRFNHMGALQRAANYPAWVNTGAAGFGSYTIGLFVGSGNE